MAILSFSAMFSITLKDIIYTITMYFYSFRLAFSSILHCIQHQNALRLAPKRIAFSIKTHCIQHQNALRLAPKCTAFSTKMHCVQHPTDSNLVQIEVLCNAYSLCLHLQPTPFYIKTNLRENRFFEARRAIGEQKGHS